MTNASASTFSVGDRVIVDNESLATNLETGTVTAIKDTGLVVIKFDSFNPDDTRGGRSHNAYRPCNLRRTTPKTVSTPAIAPAGTSTLPVKGVEFVASLYDGDEFIYMMTSDDDQELTDAIVRKFIAEETQDPGVKIIKAPSGHRWNTEAEYRSNVVKVEPRVKEVCVLTRKPEYVFVYLGIGLMGETVKLPYDGSTDLGYAVKAVYSRSIEGFIGCKVHVLDQAYNSRSAFIISGGACHEPERGMFKLCGHTHMAKI